MESSSAPVARPASAGLDPRRWWALALLCGAFFMVLLDGTITIVALPSIGADLGFSKQDLAWVLSAYALTFGGPLVDGPGWRWIFFINIPMRSAFGAARPPRQLPSQRHGGRQRAPQPEGART